MGYYREQQYFNDLTISGIYRPGISYEPIIDLFNNDDIYLKLEGIEIESDSEKLTNPGNISILCIVIDWGDGKTDKLTPENFVKNASTIGTVYDSWMNKGHEYHLHKWTDKIELKITIYSTMNEKIVIIVPIQIKLKTFTESRAKFELISANITNDNRISYVINDATTKQMIVLNSAKDDWPENKFFLDKNDRFLEQ